jgi:hypothetical protein
MLQGEVPQHGRLRDSPSRGNIMHEYGRVESGRTALRESFAPAGPTKFQAHTHRGPEERMEVMDGLYNSRKGCMEILIFGCVRKLVDRLEN